MIDLLRRLFSGPEPHPLEPMPQPAVTRGGQPEPVSPSVLLIVHNPMIPQKGGLKAQQAYGWQDPDALAGGYIDDLRACSGGYLNYRIVERIEVDGFPLKKDGFRYTPESFHRAWNSRQFHQPDAVDYLTIVREFDLIKRINSGQIDEVWLMGFPYCGYYESIMAGPGAFWCNAPPLAGTEMAARRFIIMGFNYERGVGEMLENFGHRAESILRKVYEKKMGSANLWERFTRFDKKYPGQAEVGTVHYAPNSEKDYDWGNRRPVMSRADTWLSFPDLSGPGRVMTCADWGNGDIRLHHRWWLARLPHVTGETDGISHNWWAYVVDPNRVQG